jgi:hypothetical protein
MNRFQTLEIIGVCIIIGFQLYIFFRTKRKISLFKSIFPDVDHFEIIHPGFTKSYFELHPKDLLLNWRKYSQASIPKIIQPEYITTQDFPLYAKQFEDDNRVFVDLINKKSGGNDVTDKFIYALNTYLIRNKGVASDFHLIKDVVERNTDAVEDDINQTISLPLYLGLLGTFLGIVFGLFQISGVDFATDPTALDEAISLLLGGVKIAMIASFTGLLLTILNSGYFFRGAKTLVENKKNDFYTFIQIELLPLLNQNINSTLFSLQSNLHKFNEEFKGNIGKLSSVMGKNHDALIAQEKMLTTLDNMDIMEFAKANVTVLRELQVSTDKFAEFNMYLSAINELVNNTKGFTFKLNEMIERTGNFHELGKQIVTIFSENQELVRFLQSHYNSLDNSHQLITKAVNSVGDTLDESLVKLKEFTQERIMEVQKITLKELDLMQNQYPEKWKNLDNLSHLESVNKNLFDMKVSNASLMGSVTSEIRSFNEKLSKVIIELEAIKQNGRNSLTGKLSGSFRKMFKKKERV